MIQNLCWRVPFLLILYEIANLWMISFVSDQEHPNCGEIVVWGSRVQAQGRIFFTDEDKIMDSTEDSLSCGALIE